MPQQNEHPCIPVIYYPGDDGLDSPETTLPESPDLLVQARFDLDSPANELEADHA
jgi:hypothetical protein